MAENRSVLQQIIGSISQSPAFPGTEKRKPWTAYENLILHIHPKKIPLETLRFTLTWGLGGMCVVLLLLLGMSGVLLLFVYEPFPEKAYPSVVAIQRHVLFGQLIRNVHHWSANFLIVIAFLHLLRVFFTGAFHTVRQFNWVIGVCLFTVILLSNFTGYLLPWDQLAYWAITISTGMTEYIPVVGGSIKAMLQGGDETGSATLLIFFTLHTTVLPMTMGILTLYHFWRIRKAGGVVMPPAPDKPVMVNTIPNLLLREGVVAAVLIAIIMVVSMLMDAPLGDVANPGLSPNPAKSPWYFLGIQELLLHFHPLFAVFIIPTALFLTLLLIPYLPYDAHHAGVWFVSKQGEKAGVTAAVAALLLVPPAIILSGHDIATPSWLNAMPPIISNGLIPAVLTLFAVTLIYRGIKKFLTTANNESIQALFILGVVSFVLLTVTGIWFRGEGMGLMWPFHR